MEFKTMESAELEARKSAIVSESEAEQNLEKLNALQEEMRAINQELEARKQEAMEKQEIRDAISKQSVITEIIEERDTQMAEIEVRDSKEYIEAYANYIKTNDDSECRALVTDNNSGSVPVPTLVSDIVKHAWDEEGIMSRVKKAYVQGNLKVGFEISSTGAVVHTENSGAVNEETLSLGIVTMVPANIKKWISVTDEVMDLRGQAFLTYVYQELAYQIAKKCADELISKIGACTASGTSTTPVVPEITASTIAVGTVAEALGQLSDECANPVVIMNKATWSAFKAAQYANKFNVDPFEGLPVVFNNSLDAYSSALTTGTTYAIVGDLGHGALANFPNGEELKFNFDDKTLATSDLVRIIGREFVALGVVAPKAFCKIKA